MKFHHHPSSLFTTFLVRDKGPMRPYQEYREASLTIPFFQEKYGKSLEASQESFFLFDTPDYWLLRNGYLLEFHFTGSASAAQTGEAEGSEGKKGGEIGWSNREVSGFISSSSSNSSSSSLDDLEENLPPSEKIGAAPHITLLSLDGSFSGLSSKDDLDYSNEITSNPTRTIHGVGPNTPSPLVNAKERRDKSPYFVSYRSKKGPHLVGEVGKIPSLKNLPEEFDLADENFQSLYKITDFESMASNSLALETARAKLALSSQTSSRRSLREQALARANNKGRKEGIDLSSYHPKLPSNKKAWYFQEKFSTPSHLEKELNQSLQSLATYLYQIDKESREEYREESWEGSIGNKLLERNISEERRQAEILERERRLVEGNSKEKDRIVVEGSSENKNSQVLIVSDEERNKQLAEEREKESRESKNKVNADSGREGSAVNALAFTLSAESTEYASSVDSTESGESTSYSQSLESSQDSTIDYALTKEEERSKLLSTYFRNSEPLTDGQRRAFEHLLLEYKLSPQQLRHLPKDFWDEEISLPLFRILEDFYPQVSQANKITNAENYTLVVKRFEPFSLWEDAKEIFTCPITVNSDKELLSAIPWQAFLTKEDLSYFLSDYPYLGGFAANARPMLQVKNYIEESPKIFVNDFSPESGYCKISKYTIQEINQQDYLSIRNPNGFTFHELSLYNQLMVNDNPFPFFYFPEGEIKEWYESSNEKDKLRKYTYEASNPLLNSLLWDSPLARPSYWEFDLVHISNGGQTATPDIFTLEKRVKDGIPCVNNFFHSHLLAFLGYLNPRDYIEEEHFTYLESLPEPLQTEGLHLPLRVIFEEVFSNYLLALYSPRDYKEEDYQNLVFLMDIALKMMAKLEENKDSRASNAFLIKRMAETRKIILESPMLCMEEEEIPFLHNMRVIFRSPEFFRFMLDLNYLQAYFYSYDENPREILQRKKV